MSLALTHHERELYLADGAIGNHGRTGAYNVTATWRLTGPVDEELLLARWSQLLDATPNLVACVREGEATIVFADVDADAMSHRPLGGLVLEALLDDRCDALAHKPVDLQRSLRCGVALVATDENAHHTVAVETLDRPSVVANDLARPVEIHADDLGREPILEVFLQHCRLPRSA